jgi:hypothetical protein
MSGARRQPVQIARRGRSGLCVARTIARRVRRHGAQIARIACLASFATIAWLPALDPCCEAFAEIVGRHHGGELLALDQEPLGNAHIQPSGHGGDDAADR